jgi:hypothetical protein
MPDRQPGGAGMLESGKMNRVRKKRVSKDDKGKKPAYRAELPLKKDGGRIEMANAHATERELRDLLERDPEHFRALRALVEGRPEEVSREHLRDLRKWAFVMRDGSIRPAVKAIMTAAVRDTPDGPALVYPLDLSNPEDAATAASVEMEFDKAERDLPKRIRQAIKRLKDDDDKTPGH